jgi:LCP family protein required for cell wall assembly
MSDVSNRYARRNYGSGYEGSYDSYPQYDDYMYKDDHRSTKMRKPRRRKKKKSVLIAILIVLVAIVIALGLFCAKIDANLHSFGEPEQQEVSTSLDGSGIWGIGPVNVLLLGSDARADDPSIGARTDAIVVARIDPIAKKVSMVSIPRDTMVDIPGYGTNKINAAYAYDGASGAIDAVEGLCGIKIDHCVMIDFNGLASLVDSVGGVDVFLEEGIDDPLAGDVTVPAGAVHINGAQALALSRSRAWADGDYTRQLNQRKVIAAIAHRIMELPITDMPSAIEGGSLCVSTDDGTGCLGLMLMALELKLPGSELVMQNTHLPSDTAMIDGVSYVVADRAAVSELMIRLQNDGDVEAPLSVSSIDEDIAAASGW